MQNIELIKSIINKNTIEKQQNWLEEQTASSELFMVSFVSAPRFVGKQKLEINTPSAELLIFKNWSTDQLVRVYLLLLAEKNNPSNSFLKYIDLLFETAEIKESVALYSALPFFQNPQIFTQKATDAVRSNISDIFDAIAFDNPFPAEYFTELAWNQLVLKCIFNDKPIHRIIGIEKKANQNLANTLSDFAHERWAAGRSVPAQSWRLVINFVNEKILGDLEILFKSNKEENKIAAKLVCDNSENIVAKQLLEKYKKVKESIDSQKLNWEYLEENS